MSIGQYPESAMRMTMEQMSPHKSMILRHVKDDDASFLSMRFNDNYGIDSNVPQFHYNIERVDVPRECQITNSIVYTSSVVGNTYEEHKQPTLVPVLHKCECCGANLPTDFKCEYCGTKHHTKEIEQ